MLREWRLYLQDAIMCCDKAIGYTQGMDRLAFEADQRTYDAVLRNLEILGEAVRHIPEKVREAYPQVPWVKIAGLRNILAHAYFGVDNDIIWDVLANHIRPLARELRRIADGTQME